MRHILLVCLIVFPIFFLACGENLLPSSTGEMDGMITLEDANDRKYNLKTPGYEIQVSIREDVNADVNEILDLLDKRAAEFLECQFTTNPDIGAQEFQIPSGDKVQPLSVLRVFVVPFSFECEALDRDVCAGIYYPPSSDLIIIARVSLSPCGILRFWKHELGHRYGMDADHSNQNEFEPCSDPPDCGDDLIVLID